MACATLKRSLDWETYLANRPATKRRRCAPMCDRSMGPSCSSGSASTSPKPNSVFPDLINKKLSSENVYESIKAEIKRIRKRRQLYSTTEKMENSDSSGSGSDTSDPPSPRSERPLFTFKQVGQICERMLRERECEIREEYDNVLTAKLAEQYDSFVKFTYDQIHRSYNTAAPSYLS